MNKNKSGDYSRDTKYLLVKDLMKHKMTDTIKCISIAKDELKKSNESLSRIVRQGTFVRNEFMDLVDKELKNLWKESKTKSDKKVKWINKKIHIAPIEAEKTFKGVIVDDELLEELDKELKEDKPDENKACVLGGIEISKAEEEVLYIPPNHATYPKINMEDIKTELEKCMIKCKWGNIRDLTENEENNKKKDLGEENDDSSVKVSEKVWDQEKKSLNLGNLRATDFRNNKRVFIPKLDDDEDEINRNFVKNELIKVVEKYKNENCDKYGNIIENNLDPKKIKTIKELKNRIKEEKLVLYETDKTGKFTLDTLKNYNNKMDKHIKDDKLIN